MFCVWGDEKNMFPESQIRIHLKSDWWMLTEMRVGEDNASRMRRLLAERPGELWATGLPSPLRKPESTPSAAPENMNYFFVF
jgi:hypothetical protein